MDSLIETIINFMGARVNNLNETFPLFGKIIDIEISKPVM